MPIDTNEVAAIKSFYYYKHASMRLSWVAVVVSNLQTYCTSQWMAVLRMFIAPTATKLLVFAVRK